MLFEKKIALILSLPLQFSLVLSLFSCQPRSPRLRPNSAPEPRGLIIPTQALPPITNSEEAIEWPNGQVSFMLSIKGIQYLQVNGLMAPLAYSQRLEFGNPVHNQSVNQLIRKDIEKSLRVLEQAVDAEFLMKKVIGETGFYSMWIPYSPNLWSKLQDVKELPTTLTLEVVTSDPKEIQNMRKLSQEINTAMAAAGSRDNTDGFSGLQRIGVNQEFLQNLDAELGSKIDGSLVKVGIADTGITFNHPSFLDQFGQSRIAYMKDFTLEGKVYFPDTARFSVRLGTDAEAKSIGSKTENLLIAEDVSAHVSPTAAMPFADGKNLIKLAADTPLQVPSAIRDAVSLGATIKLGFLAETAFNGKAGEGSFDLNRNNKKDDLFALLLLMPKGSSQLQEAKIFVTLDPVGTLAADQAISLAGALDLIKALPLRDFNSSRETAVSFAERFGVALDTAQLKTSIDGTDVNAVTAAIVGYDSGTHGSHVAGIIAGRKTLANDKESTLARGVAPAAQIYADRVCSNTRGCSASLAIQDLALQAKVDVINMSLGGLNAQNDGYDVQSLLIDRLSQITNTLFVISAGNSGPGLQTVGSPSTSRLALSVAASASAAIMGRQSQLEVPTGTAKDEDFIMSFSSRGPLNNGGFKPNITAPGTQLSAVGLNQAGRSGTAIYQGTSMAAPTVTGAYALLLDAARHYNRKFPAATLPTDVSSLRKVILGSARPFDVETYESGSQLSRHGQYTWIDQGTGMIDVPAAWQALKKLAKNRVKSGIETKDLPLDTILEVRSSMTGRDGTVYDGKAAEKDKVPVYGAGLWIDTTSSRNIYSIGIARRLPLAADGMQTRDEQGDAFAKLVTTAEFFKLTTEIHGSQVEWLKANVFYTAPTGGGNRCDSSTSSSLLTVVGQGALDSQGASGINGTQESTIYFCVDRSKLAKLPKGDHGALIRAFRTSADGNVSESVPAFIIPVYLALPHETLTAGKAYSVAEGQVKALGVSRNYIEVPADLSSIKLSLKVNKATLDASGQVQNCASVAMSVYAGSNTEQPEAFNAASATNCTGPGYSQGPNDETRSQFEAELMAPKAGLWDMHVLGASRFPMSQYQLRVDYAKASPEQREIKGSWDALGGMIDIEIREISRSSRVSAEKSSYTFNQALARSKILIKEGEKIDIPDHQAKVLRLYPANISKVEITSGGAAGSDVDLELFECALSGEDCKELSMSAGASDQEIVRFVPAAEKAYKVVAEGFKIVGTQAEVQMTETLTLNIVAQGLVTAKILGSDKFWTVGYSIDRQEALFKSAVFLGDQPYEILGLLKISSPDLTLANIPVNIQVK